jgi:MoaA/NifB/PqqE/SkfB family radical SAM enzyme
MAYTDPEIVAPARLVLQIDDTDLPGTMGNSGEITIHAWHQLIAQVVEWIGPVPVTIIATHSADDPLVDGLVRFAHRLECHTTLVTDGTGIDEDRADMLLDVGLSAVRVLVGGVSDGVQRQTVGNFAHEATRAVAALLGARRSRGAPLDVEIATPWVDGVTDELTAVVGWAKQAGADGFRVVAPYKASRLPADPELLDAVVDDAGTFCRNSAYSIDELHSMVAHQDGGPGIARSHTQRRGKCPVGGQRLVVGARRAVYSCPFHAPIGVLGDELSEVWAQAGSHLDAISNCSRACVHTELAPQPILG